MSKETSSQEKLEMMLADGKISEDEFHELWGAMKSQSEPASTPTKTTSVKGWFEKEVQKEGRTVRETTAALLCAIMQIVGFICLILHIPIIPSIGGFAAILAFILLPKRNPKLRVLFGTAAVSGLVIIILELSHYM